MTAPEEVRLARHALDLDEDGHDVHIPPLADDGDMLYLEVVNAATVAEGATMWASSAHGSYPVSNLIDGNDATIWHPLASMTGQWAMVELDVPRTVSAWRIFISTTANEIPAYWILQYSDDGITGWTTADTIAGGAGGDFGIRDLDEPAEAKWWRILSSGVVVWDPAVYTLELFTTALAATPSTTAGRAVLAGGGAAPTTADFLVGTAQAGLSAEIVVGTTPGGELGGTWPSPTVDPTHSGSTHAATQAAAEATAAAALAAHVAAGGGIDHVHVDNLAFSGDGSTTAFELPAAPFDAYSVKAYVAGLRTAITLSGTMLTTMTFGSAPASGTDNVTVDVVAAVA